MRSIFAVITMLSASIAVAHTAQAQQHTQRPSGYSQTQAHHPEPANDYLRPSEGDFNKIEMDNRNLDLPASQDNTIGAGQVHSEQEDLSKKIEEDSVRINREIMNICPSC